ncbi:tRNA wybutosine-synthesizing protein 2 homolog isoform X1 [Octopus sinensis]|uniref:tRNA wybutosine-synthesizing protein 2 homolog n=2 Tax=Octopus sinensis TaxID=2607531 RepID=A0A6P7SFD9_9MOLL|nr:tRNA wybutosine-synthesizing protein 2 homolog isoform X1 [Octopus sinensis]
MYQLTSAVIVPAQKAQRIRQFLENKCLIDAKFRLKHLESDRVAIPLLSVDQELLHKTLSDYFSLGDGCDFELKMVKMMPSKRSLLRSPYQLLIQGLEKLLTDHGYILNKELELDIAKKWEWHEDLVMLPKNSFKHEIWAQFGSELWETISNCLQCKRLARKEVISNNDYRRPQVTLLLGNSGWVRHVDNGIRYHYDVTKCMLSAGNITEKLRISTFDCRHETIVDLYSGIGYFTLPYLVHAKASMVHACEWNPDAVHALRENLKLNKVEDRCIIHFGDNKKVCPHGVADRVNLGLLPSSREGWLPACLSLKSDIGGILHIHENVSTASSNKSEEIRMRIQNRAAEAAAELSATLQGQTPSLPLYRNINQHCGGNSSSSSSTSSIPRQSYLPSDFGKYSMEENYTTDSDDGDIIKIYETLNSDQPLSEKQLQRQEKWEEWAADVAASIRHILEELHCKPWATIVKHIEHVKPYAPHIDHLVLDLECRPAETFSHAGMNY